MVRWKKNNVRNSNVNYMLSSTKSLQLLTRKKAWENFRVTDILMVVVVVIVNLMNVTKVNKNTIKKAKPQVLKKRVANIMVLRHIILWKSVTRIQEIWNLLQTRKTIATEAKFIILMLDTKQIQKMTTTPKEVTLKLIHLIMIGVGVIAITWKTAITVHIMWTICRKKENCTKQWQKSEIFL